MAVLMDVTMLERRCTSLISGVVAMSMRVVTQAEAEDPNLSCQVDLFTFSSYVRGRKQLLDAITKSIIKVVGDGYSDYPYDVKVCDIEGSRFAFTGPPKTRRE